MADLVKLPSPNIGARGALDKVKDLGGISFMLSSDFKPTGDQPRAISQLVNGVNDGLSDQVLLGVTGSGKTFTMANVIARTGKPALILAHNKTLAAQLY